MKPRRFVFLSLGLIALLALFWYAQVTVYRRPVEKALVAEVKAGNMSMVRLLLQRGADPGTQDEAHIGLATWALLNDKVDIARVLMERGAPVDVHFCMTDAMAKQRPDIALLLLKHGASPNIRDDQGRTPLLLFSYSGAETVDALVAKGADVNARSADGTTALMSAAEGHDAAPVKALLRHGADPNARNAKGQTALLLAAANLSQYGKADMIQALLDGGADPDARSGEGNTALVLAVRQQRTAAARLLLQKGADVNARGPLGTTPLIEAVRLGEVEVIEALLAAGADVTLRHESGKTARDYAKALEKTPPYLYWAEGAKWVKDVLSHAEAERARRGGKQPATAAVTAVK